MTIDDLYIILLSDKPSEELKKHEQALFELIPELEICKGFEQKNDWHIYDVYEHILHVVDYIPKDITLRLAALFHDIGKPILYKEDENGIRHFYGHWDESKKIFDAFSEKYNIDKELSNSVSTLIQYHDISSDRLTQEDIDKLGINGIKRLFIFKKADLRAQNKKYHYISDDYKNQEDNLLLKLKGVK
jgi:tRNA nucleotidyltransferase (CCA-adding enzyme)